MELIVSFLLVAMAGGSAGFLVGWGLGAWSGYRRGRASLETGWPNRWSRRP